MLQRLNRQLRTLLTQQPGPLLDFIDVGARDGIPPHWNRFRELVRTVAVEPDTEEAARLSGEVIPHALADVAGERVLYLTENPACSSLHEPNVQFLAAFPAPERMRIARTVRVTTQTLDATCRTAPSFLKIDVQGAEGLVLRGAAKTLDRHIAGIEVETCFAPLYCGQTAFGDVHERITRAGFELVDLRHTYWRREIARDVPGTRGQLAFGDALYLISPTTLQQRPHLASAALATCVVYGLYDWIVAYSAAVPEHRLLARATAIVKQRRSREFRGRQRIGLWLKDIADAILESSEIWGRSDGRIGGTSRL